MSIVVYTFPSSLQTFLFNQANINQLIHAEYQNTGVHTSPLNSDFSLTIKYLSVKLYWLVFDIYSEIFVWELEFLVHGCIIKEKFNSKNIS